MRWTHASVAFPFGFEGAPCGGRQEVPRECGRPNVEIAQARLDNSPSSTATRITCIVLGIIGLIVYLVGALQQVSEEPYTGQRIDECNNA